MRKFLIPCALILTISLCAFAIVMFLRSDDPSDQHPPVIAETDLSTVEVLKVRSFTDFSGFGVGEVDNTEGYIAPTSYSNNRRHFIGRGDTNYERIEFEAEDEEGETIIVRPANWLAGYRRFNNYTLLMYRCYTAPRWQGYFATYSFTTSKNPYSQSILFLMDNRTGQIIELDFAYRIYVPFNSPFVMPVFNVESEDSIFMAVAGAIVTNDGWHMVRISIENGELQVERVMERSTEFLRAAQFSPIARPSTGYSRVFLTADRYNNIFTAEVRNLRGAYADIRYYITTKGETTLYEEQFDAIWFMTIILDTPFTLISSGRVHYRETTKHFDRNGDLIDTGFLPPEIEFDMPILTGLRGRTNLFNIAFVYDGSYFFMHHQQLWYIPENAPNLLYRLTWIDEIFYTIEPVDLPPMSGAVHFRGGFYHTVRISDMFSPGIPQSRFELRRFDFFTGDTVVIHEFEEYAFGMNVHFVGREAIVLFAMLNTTSFIVITPDGEISQVPMMQFDQESGRWIVHEFSFR